MECPRYPKNAPGPFYVADQCCIKCRAPEREAPDLMNNDGDSCYFHRQPATPEELDRAIDAIRVNCVEAVRYAGHDPSILERLYEDACDIYGTYNPLEPPRAEVVWNWPDDVSADIPDVTDNAPHPSPRDHPLWDRDLDGGI